MSLYQNLLLLLCGLGCFVFPKFSYGQFIDAQVDSIAQLSSPSFLQDFPFKEYRNYLSDASPAALVKDVELLRENKGPVDAFLDSVHFFQLRYIEEHSDDFEYMLQYLRTGETLLQLDGIKKGFIFPAFGDLILQGLTTQLDKGLAEQIYSPSNKEVQYLIRRLRENKFFVNVPVSDWNKGFTHLKNGNLGYLFRKFRLKQPFLFYSSILLITLLSGLGIFYLLKKKQKF